MSPSVEQKLLLVSELESSLMGTGSKECRIWSAFIGKLPSVFLWAPWGHDNGPQPRSRRKAVHCSGEVTGKVP